MTNTPTYDVALSFAQENRKIASDLARSLKKRGLKVFHDPSGTENLVGKDLHQHLKQMYSSSRFAIILVSYAYLSHSWTQFELETAVARARETTYHILPVRLDHCQLPGSLKSIAYLDLRKSSSLEEVADAIFDNVSAESGEAPSPYPEQQRVHIISREKAWSVKYEGRKKAWRVVDSKSAALALAQTLLLDGSTTEVVVHKTDGSVEKRFGLNS